MSVPNRSAPGKSLACINHPAAAHPCSVPVRTWGASGGTEQIVWNIYPLHAGGINNAVFADGSVRPVSNNIDLFAWSAWVTPAGGEVNNNNE